MSLFITAVGVLCVICGVLAALLVLADRFVNDYGECRIRINGGDRELVVAGGESLLGTLGRESLFIPSACGGRGSCGLCKLTVHSGAPPLLPTEEPHLSAEEITDNVRLSCQIKVREDMDIEIPPELFSIREYRATVASIEDLTHDIKRLRLELIDPETIEFTPGQYIQLQAPVYAKNPEPVYRAYSVASDARDTRHVELVVRRVPEGICTTWVFDHLSEGEEVLFNGPYGDFFLQESECDMVFVAGGSGMAPFLSILADMKHRGIQRKCTYFFGAVAKRDLFCLETMRQFEQDLANFTFVPCLSQPTEEDAWDGETGLVTEVLNRHFPDLSAYEGYLCGSPGMIDAAVAVMSQNGMSDDRIFYDKFA